MSSQSTPRSTLTHIGEDGRPAMVDVSSKPVTKRTASAQGRIYISKLAFDLINSQAAGTVDPSAQLTSHLDAETTRRLEKARSKGSVLTVAQLAGIMASKRTADLVPLCHPIPLTHVSVTLTLEGPDEMLREGMDDQTKDPVLLYSVVCRATVSCTGRTGVEMEALTAVSASLLTVWDMLKAVTGKEMIISDVFVSNKEGGKSGDFSRSLERCGARP